MITKAIQALRNGDALLAMILLYEAKNQVEGHLEDIHRAGVEDHSQELIEWLLKAD